jgi:hypothetical protein
MPLKPDPDEPASEGLEGSGPESIGERELRREVWRLRDQVFGLEAECAQLKSALLKSDAARREAQYRADALDDARANRDAMLESTRWRVGGAVLHPLRFVRRLFSRSAPAS